MPKLALDCRLRNYSLQVPKPIFLDMSIYTGAEATVTRRIKTRERILTIQTFTLYVHSILNLFLQLNSRNICKKQNLILILVEYSNPETTQGNISFP